MAWFPWRRKNKDRKATVIQESGGSRYVEVGGRRHLADAPYVLPHDDQEINRLDFQHYMLRYALRGNYAAPIGTPASILDVGSGTGRWAMEMAAYFPDTNVVATDIVAPPEQATQPADMGLDRRPENYTVCAGQCAERPLIRRWQLRFRAYAPAHFREPEAAWPKVVSELVRVTRPGGWIELVETGPQQDGGPAMDMIVEWVTQAS